MHNITQIHQTYDSRVHTYACNVLNTTICMRYHSLNAGVMLLIDPITTWILNILSQLGYWSILSPLLMLKHPTDSWMHEHMTHQMHTFIQDLTIINITTLYTCIHRHFIHIYIFFINNYHHHNHHQTFTTTKKQHSFI